MERLVQYEAERSKIREEIARKAKELEKQAAKDKQNQEMQQKALEAMNEHITKKEQEYNKKYGAQVSKLNALLFFWFHHHHRAQLLQLQA